MKKSEKKKDKDVRLASAFRITKPLFWVERHSKEDGILTRLESEDIIERKPKKDKVVA